MKRCDIATDFDTEISDFLWVCNGLFQDETVGGFMDGVRKCLQGCVSVEQQTVRRKTDTYRKGLSTGEHTILQYYCEIKTNLFNKDGNVCY